MQMHDRQRAANARQSIAVTTTANVRPDWLSSRAIDLWLLAVCSFLLTLLCHSVTNLPDRPANASNSAPPTSSSSGATTNFAFRLFTLTSSKPELKTEE